MKIEWKYCWRICISLFVLYLCIAYWSVAATFISLMFGAITPLIIGFVMAYLLNIIMVFYEEHYFPKQQKKDIVISTKRPVCMILAYISMIGVIVLLSVMIIPELVSAVALLMDKLPTVAHDLVKNRQLHKVIPEDILSRLDSMDWKSYSEKILKFLTSGITGTVSTVASVASSVFSTVVSVVMGIIFSIYFLTGKERLIGQIKRFLKIWVSNKYYNKVMHYCEVANECFHHYIVGKFLDALVLGGMCAMGMLIFQLPYAVMIGALVGFTALIPIVGAYVGAAVGAIMILTISPWKALFFILFILILQQVEGNIIYPKIMSNSIGLPGVWVLAAITIGGSLAGIIGMLIGVPVVAFIYQIIKESVLKREKENREPLSVEFGFEQLEKDKKK